MAHSDYNLVQYLFTNKPDGVTDISPYLLDADELNSDFQWLSIISRERWLISNEDSEITEHASTSQTQAVWNIEIDGFCNIGDIVSIKRSDGSNKYWWKVKIANASIIQFSDANLITSDQTTFADYTTLRDAPCHIFRESIGYGDVANDCLGNWIDGSNIMPLSIQGTSIASYTIQTRHYTLASITNACLGSTCIGSYNIQSASINNTHFSSNTRFLCPITFKFGATCNTSDYASMCGSTDACGFLSKSSGQITQWGVRWNGLLGTIPSAGTRLKIMLNGTDAGSQLYIVCDGASRYQASTNTLVTYLSEGDYINVMIDSTGIVGDLLGDHRGTINLMLADETLLTS